MLTLATREDAALAVAGFGVWLALARGRWRTGATVAVLSVALLAVDIAWVMPYFRGEPYPHLHLHTHVGNSFGDILVTLVARPWRWLPAVLSAPKLLYLGQMLVPLGVLPVLAPCALAGALPGLPINLLSLGAVSVNERIQPHLAEQREAYVFPARGAVLPAYVLDLEGVITGAAATGAFPRERYDEIGRAGSWVLLARRS